METLQPVFEYLNSKGWMVLGDIGEQIELIGRSGRNENYLISVNEIYGESRFVLRVNHGSRLGLTDQAEYEFVVLQALRRSGVTPRPFYCDVESCASLGQGALFMEYMPGRPLCYAGDWGKAADILAAVHSQPVDGRLMVQADPLGGMVRECAGLEKRFDALRHATVKAGFDSCLDELREVADAARELMPDEAGVITHGGPYSSDFIIDDEMGNAWLVDWECGAVSSRYLDLGTFMGHAALAGEMGFCRNDVERLRFIERYVAAAGLDISNDEALRRSELFEQGAALRAMIWNCVALTGNLEGIQP